MRDRVVNEALSFVGTPYRKNGRVKGGGVDCGTFLFCVFLNCGMVSPEEEGIFSDPSIVPTSQDWWCHTNVEKYMLRLIRHAYKVAEGISYPTLKAQPGDMVLTRALDSKLYNHGGIVLQWPRIIHALWPSVQIVDASTHELWQFQQTVVLDPFAKLEAEKKTA